MRQEKKVEGTYRMTGEVMFASQSSHYQKHVFDPGRGLWKVRRQRVSEAGLESTFSFLSAFKKYLFITEEERKSTSRRRGQRERNSSRVCAQCQALRRP